MICGGKTVTHGAHSDNLIAELTGTLDIDQEAHEVLCVAVKDGLPTIGTTAREIASNAITDINIANFSRQQPGWHCWISPNKAMSDSDWRRTWEIYEEVLDLKGHSYFSACHAKGNRVNHEHRYYDRSHADGKAQNIWQSKYRDETARLIAEFELKHEFTVFDKFHETRIMKYLKAHNRTDVMTWVREQVLIHGYSEKAVTTQKERAENLKAAISHADVAKLVVECWHRANSGAEFQTELAKHGLTIARGDKVENTLMITGQGITDAALTRLLVAGHKALGRKLEMPKARDAAAAVAEKFANIDIASMPTLSELRTPSAVAKADTLEQRQVEKEIKVLDVATVKPIKDPLKLVSGESCIWSDQRLRKACMRAAHGAHEKARELYRAAVKSERLLTVAVMDGERYYTTRGLIDAERSLRAHLAAAIGDDSLCADALRAEQIINKFDSEFRNRSWNTLQKGLGEDQKNNIRNLTLTKSGIVAYSGVAGGGKTLSLECCVRIWRDQGVKLFGVAPSGKAAVNLKSSGIADCRAVQGLIIKLDREAAYRSHDLAATWIGHDGKLRTVKSEMIVRALQQLQKVRAPQLKAFYSDQINILNQYHSVDDIPRNARKYISDQIDFVARKAVDNRSVVVLDEAGMVGLELMNSLVMKVRAVGARLAQGGDIEQLQPVQQAGAAFRLATTNIETSVIATVVRQHEEWQREATSKFFSGKPEKAAEAINSYVEKGYVKIGIRGDADINQLVKDAGKLLERTITLEERHQIEVLLDYKHARLLAGSLWGDEISPFVEAGNKAEDHEFYSVFRDAADRRDEAASVIYDNISDYRDWIARYNLSGDGLAADILVAGGTSRRTAEEQSAEYARTLDLLPHSPDIELKLNARGQAREDLIKDWTSDLLGSIDSSGQITKTSLLLAFNRDDVTKLNEGARAAMRANNLLGTDEITIDAVIPGRDGEQDEHYNLTLSVGDRVQFLQNQGQVLDIDGKWVDGRKNGEFATVIEIEQKDIHTYLNVRVDDQDKTVQIRADQYKTMALGYASTVSKSQGSTVDRCYVLISSFFERHLYYVAMTRHREFAKLYAAASDFLNKNLLLRSAMKERTADLVSDHVDINTIPTNGIETAEDRSISIRNIEASSRKEQNHEQNTRAKQGRAGRDEESIRASSFSNRASKTSAAEDRLSEVLSSNTIQREHRHSENILSGDAQDSIRERNTGAFNRDLQRSEAVTIASAEKLAETESLLSTPKQAPPSARETRNNAEIKSAIFAAAAEIRPDLVKQKVTANDTIKSVEPEISLTSANEVGLGAINCGPGPTERDTIISTECFSSNKSRDRSAPEMVEVSEINEVKAMNTTFATRSDPVRIIGDKTATQTEVADFWRQRGAKVTTSHPHILAQTPNICCEDGGNIFDIHSAIDFAAAGEVAAITAERGWTKVHISGGTAEEQQLLSNAYQRIGLQISSEHQKLYQSPEAKLAPTLSRRQRL